ncbi:MAG: hypothetical protein KatS3mg110_0948 [Pirellulaceae bacterium]|nr:MAG: hypothetical protein KatS3mg110_0948 [Pirellulaceae bacterium]
MLIYLIWDTSGSMAESGKLWIARSVARAVEQYLRLGYGRADLKLIAWGDEARHVEWVAEDDFPLELLTAAGSSSAKALTALLGNQPGGKVLLLTDGFWSYPDAKELKRWKQSLPRDTVRIIKIGVDANPHLKGADVFKAEDLFLALHGWIERGSQ